jgi:hypothetical protein
MSNRDSVNFSPLPPREAGFFLVTLDDLKDARDHAKQLAKYQSVTAYIFTTPHGQWQVTNHESNAHPDAILVETVEAEGVYA